jgi:multidrug efflux system outer membrane protein
VIDSERQVLTTQLQASHLSGTQAVSTVNLIRALGGGWGDAKAGNTAVGSGSAAPASAGLQVQVAKQ